MEYDLTVSVVLYKTKTSIVEQAIESIYRSKLAFKLYLIDNSPTDELKALCRDPRCVYIFNDANLGFGRAHNIALRYGIEEAKYHLVLNPDIYFQNDVLEELIKFMENNPDVGQVMPKVLYPDGQVQYLCKLLPTPADLLLRRFFPWLPKAEKRNRTYELRDSGYNKLMNIPNLSGCFMLFRTSAIRMVGLFDEKIFMYLEDADITRRMHMSFKTIFYPFVSVNHHFAKGSYKSLRLLLYHLHAAMIYFSKWGWVYDPVRRRLNRQVIREYLSELHQRTII